MILKFMLLGGVLPGLLASAAFLLAWWSRRKGDAADASGPAWLAPMVLALCVLPAELLAREGLPALWPRGAPDRLPHLALFVGAAGVVLALIRRAAVTTAAISIVAMSGALWAIVFPRVPHGMTAGNATIWMVALAVVATEAARLIERHDARCRGPCTLLVLALALNALPLVLLKGGTAYVAQLSGGLAAGVAAMLLISLVIPSFRPGPGGVFVAVGLGACLATAGVLYAEVPRVQATLVALSLGAVFVERVPLVARLGTIARTAVVGGSACVPLGVAAGLAFSAGGSSYAAHVS